MDFTTPIWIQKSTFHNTTMSPYNRYNKQKLEEQYCSAVFLDFSKAFDKFWHPGLLLKPNKPCPQGTLNYLNHTYKRDIT
jgi:hypothetical protein